MSKETNDALVNAHYGHDAHPIVDNKPAAAQEAVAIEVPNGAIFNGNAYADRLETYGFECEAGPLTNCNDWVEFRRCFNHLADWAYSLPPIYAAPVTAAPGIDLRSQMLRLAEKWERHAAEHGVRQFTGNDHLLFANELRAQIDASPKGACHPDDSAGDAEVQP